MVNAISRRFGPRRLDAPRRATRFQAHYDPDAFGRFSERIARFLGTGRYLVGQTVLVVVWISYNVIGAALGWKIWDSYPFILLNLAFSTQAASSTPARRRSCSTTRLACISCWGSHDVALAVLEQVSDTAPCPLRRRPRRPNRLQTGRSLPACGRAVAVS